MIGRVLQGVGGAYRVRAGGRDLDCSLRGRIKQGSGSIAVGDRVEIEQLEDGSCCISGILPRESVLARRSVARRRDQVMAANVDQLAAVVSATRPPPDLHMLDRLLAVAELHDLAAFVICNKSDLAEELPQELEIYRSLGYDILRTSTKEPSGIPEFHRRISGHTTVLAGASGVGKSSLLNSVLPGLDLRVGDVGERSGRGKHTTTSAQLIPLDDDSYIADTPGIQQFVPTGLTVAEIGGAFREIGAEGGSCRFADCKHRHEPGCAVLAALAEGRIDARRHESYLALLADTETAVAEARDGGSRG